LESPKGEQKSEQNLWSAAHRSPKLFSQRRFGVQAPGLHCWWLKAQLTAAAFLPKYRRPFMARPPASQPSRSVLQTFFLFPFFPSSNQATTSASRKPLPALLELLSSLKGGNGGA